MTKKRMKVKLGRPLKYKNSVELENNISNYFKSCQHERRIPGISGLASWLGITRKTLLNYESNQDLEDYSEVIERAKTTIEAYNEQLLYNKTTSAGAQFVLKHNCGYIDKMEVNNTNKNINMSLEEYLESSLSNEEY
nr:MAG TPA: DNA packaging protein gp3 [Caudoviricetes sp.]